MGGGGVCGGGGGESAQQATCDMLVAIESDKCHTKVPWVAQVGSSTACVAACGPLLL
jgi:hypothetical protein